MAECQDKKKRKQHQLLLLAAVAGVILLSLCALTTLLCSLTGLAVAAPLFVLSSPVLVPAALLGCLLATGAAVSAALALGAISILRRLRLPQDAARREVEKGKRRLGEVAAVAGEPSPHAALAVVSRGQQGATDHKKSHNYEHYVAGRMVQNA